jgi:glutamate carboxypeptidase
METYMDGLKLLDLFAKRNEAIISKIHELVEIESPSFDINGSVEAADWIEGGFKASSPDCVSERIVTDDVGEHLVVRIDGDTDTKPILLLGHSDTVHPLGSLTANPTRVENGRLYGCGTFDMKANIAVMIEVFRAFSELGLKPKRPVTILIACDEEVGSESGRPIVEREALKSEFCLVFEPSLDGKVKTARKGTGEFVLKTHGIPSHAGLDPKKGASAILEISKQIEKLHGMTDFSIGTTVCVGKIKGGTATNVVPAEAECSIDVRFATLEEAANIEREFRSLTPFDERVSLEILGEVNRPPMERTEGVAALFEKARTLAAGFGYKLEETKVGGASDGNFVGALGIPLLDGLGIAGDGAHTLDEYIVIDDIPNRAALLAKLLLDG